MQNSCQKFCKMGNYDYLCKRNKGLGKSELL